MRVLVDPRRILFAQIEEVVGLATPALLHRLEGDVLLARPASPLLDVVRLLVDADLELGRSLVAGIHWSRIDRFTWRKSKIHKIGGFGSVDIRYRNLRRGLQATGHQRNISKGRWADLPSRLLVGFPLSIPDPATGAGLPGSQLPGTANTAANSGGDII